MLYYLQEYNIYLYTYISMEWLEENMNYDSMVINMFILFYITFVSVVSYYYHLAYYAKNPCYNSYLLFLIIPIYITEVSNNI